jgi:hypothetical protein
MRVVVDGVGFAHSTNTTAVVLCMYAATTICTFGSNATVVTEGSR